VKKSQLSTADLITIGRIGGAVLLENVATSAAAVGSLPTAMYFGNLEGRACRYQTSNPEGP
jgi:hypothetical protein